MNILTTTKLYVKPINEVQGKDGESRNPSNNPLDYIIHVSYTEAPKTEEGYDLTLRSTTPRSCRVFYDPDGTPDNQWRIQELNTSDAALNEMYAEGKEPCVRTLKFQIPVFYCKETEKCSRWMANFMCPYRIDSIKVIVMKATTENLTCKVLNKDTDEYYECSSRARARARTFLENVQNAFINMKSGSSVISVEELREKYLVDVFAKDYDEVENHLVYTQNGRTNWAVTKDMLSKVSVMLPSLPRNIKKYTTSMSLLPMCGVYNKHQKADGGKANGAKGQNTGKSGHTEPS